MTLSPLFVSRVSAPSAYCDRASVLPRTCCLSHKRDVLSRTPLRAVGVTVRLCGLRQVRVGKPRAAGGPAGDDAPALQLVVVPSKEGRAVLSLHDLPSCVAGAALSVALFCFNAGHRAGQSVCCLCAAVGAG